jgi:MFS family permease
VLERLRKVRAFQALRFREFRLLWYGQSLGSMGTWMDEVARGWLIYELTDSVVQLGLVRGIQAIPLLLLSPIAGSFADRHSRRAILIVSQTLHAAIYAVTAALIFTGEIRAWHVYVTGVLMASVSVFQHPARGSLVSEAVPREHLVNAIGLSSVTFNLARIVGPAVAGALIVLIGTGGAYTAQCLCLFIAAGLAVAQQQVPHPAHAAKRASFGRSIIEGWKYSWENQTLRAGFLCVMLASLFIVPFTTLLPVFARDLLGVGASGQGLLLTAMGVGAFCSSALIAAAGDRLPRGALMFGSAVVYGVMIAVFAASHWFALSLVVMALAGLAHVHSNALVQTVIQSYSPAELRGRTLALFSMHQVLVTAGAVVFGALASLLGPRWAVAMMGSIGALSMIAILIAMPKARSIR